MQQLSIGGWSASVGDAVADLLVRYAVLLDRQRSADAIEATVLSSGGTTIASVLLDDGVALVAERVASTFDEPDNRRTEEHLRARIDALSRQQTPTLEDIAGTAGWVSGADD